MQKIDPKSRALAWMRGESWAMETGALDQMMQIASREQSNIEAVLDRRGQRLARTRAVEVREGVAIIDIVGPIFRYANYFTEISGATAIESAALDLRTALDDRDVRAIVLHIDSPGGAVAGVSDFAKQVRAGTRIKPIVSFVGGTAASAAYWIASAASWVVASDTAALGSVGVVASVRVNDESKNVEIVSAQSPYKRLDVRTDAGRAEMQKFVDSLATVFIEAVGAFRGITPARVTSDFGRGSLLVGREAVTVRMADQLGTLEGVVESFAGGGHGPAYAELVALRAAYPDGFPEKKRAASWAGTVAHMNDHRLRSGK